MNALSNARHLGESFEDYRARRKLVSARVKQYQRGIPASESKDGKLYVPGPNPTHKPKYIKKQIGISTKTGEPVFAEVVTAGTLIKIDKTVGA